MTRITIETAMLEQLVGALEGIKRAWMNEVESSCNATRDVDRAITAGRAAIANAEIPAKTMPLPEELGGRESPPFIPNNPFPKMLSDILKDTL